MNEKLNELQIAMNQLNDFIDEYKDDDVFPKDVTADYINEIDFTKNEEVINDSAHPVAWDEDYHRHITLTNNKYIYMRNEVSTFYIFSPVEDEILRLAENVAKLAKALKN